MTGRPAAPRPDDAPRPDVSAAPTAEPGTEPRPRVPDARGAPGGQGGPTGKGSKGGPTSPEGPAGAANQAGTGPTVAPFAGARPSRPASLADLPGGIEPTIGAPAHVVPRRVPVGSRPQVPTADPGPAGGTGEDGDQEPAFWLPIEEVHWDGTPVREEIAPDTGPARILAGRAGRRRPTRPVPHGPLPGLALLILLMLLASFFGWVSAEPFWLAVGHGRNGTVVVAGCTGSGLEQRCRGDFVLGDDFVVHGVRIAGVGPEQRQPRTVLPARMVSASSTTAYVDGSGAVAHLRWLLGLGLVLLCGVAAGWATGAARFTEPWARRGATWAGFCAPVLLASGFLVAAF
ncbi:hypothetical protein V6U90_26830 [Micromonospora sp. CPCC 206060]|uniref:hypothetical protein n=1 Tax=Micromonospora sp. CPCC 206060 TaxID=3122406 RepID=UPI002FF11F48